MMLTSSVWVLCSCKCNCTARSNTGGSTTNSENRYLEYFHKLSHHKASYIANVTETVSRNSAAVTVFGGE